MHKQDGDLAEREIPAQARQGAIKVLQVCLELSAGDELAVFYDETTQPTAGVLIEAANELDIRVNPRYVSSGTQAAFQEGCTLPLGDQEALSRSRAVITCLSGHRQGNVYRLALLQRGTDNNKRLGHMPGATVDLLAHAVNIDYSEATSMCDDIALALTLGESVLVRTYEFAPDGSPMRHHDLHLPVGGRRRYPITSTGIIPPGTWGNIPGGETFIAPMEDAVEGRYVLNGSFRGTVLAPLLQLVLEFHGGRLKGVDGDLPLREQFDKLLAGAREKADPHFECLGELGIGVNRGITHLTGQPLVDEKMYGTVHIALGRNKQYGGEYQSMIHEDLVTCNPSVWVDNSPIVDQGNFVFEPHRWRETLDGAGGDFASVAGDALIRRTGLEGDTSEDILKVRRPVGEGGRLCVYTVGDAHASRLLARLYRRVPGNFSPIRLDDWTRAIPPDGSESVVRQALHVLSHHGLVTVSNVHREPTQL